MFVCVGSSSNSRNAFPLVRRSTTASGSENVPATRALPRLMSLELFNPETDDMDSDSSGVSSPDSVGSVISVLNDDDHPAAQGKKLYWKYKHSNLSLTFPFTHTLSLFLVFVATPSISVVSPNAYVILSLHYYLYVIFQI